MLLDTSVIRNFGVLDLADVLLQVVQAPVVATAVMNTDNTDGEILGIRTSINDRELTGLPLGSGEHVLWLGALIGLDRMIDELTAAATFVDLDGEQEALALLLISPAPEARAWRTSHGIRRRGVHAGEAASIAVALSTVDDFATDDSDAATTYSLLTGRSAASTLTLLHAATAMEAIDEADAKAAWTRLSTRLRGRSDLAWEG